MGGVCSRPLVWLDHLPLATQDPKLAPLGGEEEKEGEEEG